VAQKGQGVARRQKQLSECAVLLPPPHRTRVRTPAQARSAAVAAAAAAAACPSSPPTYRPTDWQPPSSVRSPQSSTPEDVPPAWMSRDRPAANRRPLMSGRAPRRRLINRPALHRRQRLPGAAARIAFGTGGGHVIMVRRGCSEFTLNAHNYTWDQLSRVVP